MNGIESITQERIEQIEKHGRTVEWDVEHNPNDNLLVAAKALLALYPYPFHTYAEEYLLRLAPPQWDQSVWLHMCRKSYKKRLIIAGALIAAEIDRLDYIEQQNQANSPKTAE